MPDYYTLTEMTTRDELACAEANVVDSDATIVFSADAPAGVPLRTLEFAAKHGKPWFRACLSAQGHKKLVQDILAWLRGDPRGRACMDQESCPPKECILYVAGGAAAAQTESFNRWHRVFRTPERNGLRRYSIENRGCIYTPPR